MVLRGSAARAFVNSRNLGKLFKVEGCPSMNLEGLLRLAQSDARKMPN